MSSYDFMKKGDWKLLKEVVDCVEFLTKRQQECLLHLQWDGRLTQSTHTRYHGLWTCWGRDGRYQFFNSKTINPLFDMGLIGLGEPRGVLGWPEIQLTPAGELLVSLLFDIGY